MELLFKEAQRCESLRIIVKLGNDVTDDEKQRSKETGITIHTMDEVLVSSVSQWEREGEGLVSYLSEEEAASWCMP